MPQSYTLSEFEDILIYFSTSIMDKNTEHDIAWEVAENCISRLDFVDCVIYFLDEKEQYLEQIAAFGPKNPVERTILEPIYIKIGEGITGSVAKTRQAEIISDTDLDDRYIIDDDIRLSEICVPIMLGDELYGVIDSEHPKRNFFTKQHLKMLSAIASICAIRIRSIRADSKIKEQNSKLTKAQIELLELRVKELRSQMNPHFVHNSIRAIQNLLKSSDHKTLQNYLTDLEQLTAYHIKYLDKEQVPLGEDLKMLQSYLNLQKIRFSSKFDFQLTYKLNDDEMEQLIPGKVVSSLIENAVEKSMINDLECTKLDIYLIKELNTLRLEVYCSQIKSELSDQGFNYYDNITPWEEQVDLLNKLKNLDIERKVTILNDGIDNRGEINITITMPVYI